MTNPTCDESSGEVHAEQNNYTAGMEDANLDLNTSTNEESATDLTVPEAEKSASDMKGPAQPESEEFGAGLSVSSMNNSVAESEEIEESPRKISSDCTDSESDTSSDKVHAAKRRKKNNGNAAALKYHQQLKKTGTAFIQSKDCEKIKHPLGKCLECKKAPRMGRKGKDSICRFLSFRKLRYNKNGSLTVAGFPDAASEEDYTSEDLALWRPDTPPKGMTLERAKFLIREVGDQFCQLVKQEKETLVQLNDQLYRSVTWRRVVPTLREMCDVCSTTLFNYHWTCDKCGFVVCVSCFNTRKSIKPKPVEVQQTNLVNNLETKDAYGWLKCHARAEHAWKSLMLTQIVAGRALDDLWLKLHSLRRNLGIPEDCDCDPPQSSSSVPYREVYNKTVEPEEFTTATTDASENDDEESDGDEDDDGIMDLFDNTNGGSNDAVENKDEVRSVEQESNSKSRESPPPPTEIKPAERVHLKNFVRKSGTGSYAIKVVPKVLGSHVASNKKYKHVPHSWLCQGYLLRLMDPLNPDNLLMFQEQWKRGQPVIVSNVGEKLDPALWSPQSFSNDFGSERSNLINCMTGKLVPNRKMKEFWDGFEHVKKRLEGENGEPMLLKLKDWPPGADFANILPSRFKDLMSALPLGEYTHRDGILNLAARLPDIFCKPDLGPKMYIAYGSGLHLEKGTTNLHLDISDAVNVMVYIGVVKDDDTTEHDKAVMAAIEDSDCDFTTIKRVVENKELPGALWHIWEAKDADKIRDMINKIQIEKGFKVEPHHDAIHDQSCYLDSGMRRRLREEYNVVGYPILQCEGDAVFIPAGAPHQVRNLNNCIKIAEDFVSPENVVHCFYLTEEFRNLTETHSNHEDKLQIKNVVYHTVKDAVAVILNDLEQNQCST